MKALILVLLCAVPLSAQEPVQPVPDWASYATAAVNPAIAVVQAFRSEQPKCKLAQLAITEAIGNGVALTVKHFVVSPRPCLGCAADGMPSGHTMNSFLGGSWNWRFGVSLTLTTAELRRQANRHTTNQVLAGALLGLGAEVVGQRLVKCG